LTVILSRIRRRNAWKNARELEATAGVSLRIGNDEMADRIRWIRSYVVAEDDGTLGTVCIYQAVSAEAIREHARRVGMPANEITAVAQNRGDPGRSAGSGTGGLTHATGSGNTLPWSRSFGQGDTPQGSGLVGK